MLFGPVAASDGHVAKILKLTFTFLQQKLSRLYLKPLVMIPKVGETLQIRVGATYILK